MYLTTDSFAKMIAQNNRILALKAMFTLRMLVLHYFLIKGKLQFEIRMYVINNTVHNYMEKCGDHTYDQIISIHVCTLYAKQKHLGCKNVRGQSEATLLTGMCDQNL